MIFAMENTVNFHIFKGAEPKDEFNGYALLHENEDFAISRSKNKFYIDLVGDTGEDMFSCMCNEEEIFSLRFIPGRFVVPVDKEIRFCKNEMTYYITIHSSIITSAN